MTFPNRCLVLLGFFVLSKTSLSNKFTKKYERNFIDSNLTFTNNLSIPLELTTFDNKVQFFFFGDWGGIPTYPFKTKIQQKISNLMKNISNSQKVHFNLALGDNFYNSGVQSVKDSRFKSTFENVYQNLKIPWFLILGNHDHIGNTNAQIQYTFVSNKWILPGTSYKMTINSGRNKLAHIIFIDTTLLCKSRSASNIELKNLEFNLKEASHFEYPYLIVAGHHPVWSMGMHGSNKCLVKKLRPLLHKHRVSVYLSGHDHNLEHLKDTYLNWTVDFMVSGASSSYYNNQPSSNNIPKGSYKFYSNDLKGNGALGFAQLDLNFVNISFIRGDGKSLYNVSIPSRIKNLNG